jgi:hypothetical protein
MLVYTPFALCFVILYGVFMYFSRTNLLTRCHISAIFVFQKSYTENILEIGRNKSQSSYFFRSITESKAETEGCQRAAAPPHGAVHPLAAQGLVWAPGPLPDAALPPIYSPRRENLKDRSIFLETYCKPPPSSTQDQEGPEAIPGTLPERGITAGGLLHHHAYLRSDV